MGRTQHQSVHVGLSPVGGTPCWSRARLSGVLPWGAKSHRNNIWWTDHNPHSHPPALLRKGGREIQSEVEPRKEWGKVLLRFVLTFITLLWFDKTKLIFPQVKCFAHDSNYWVISPTPYLYHKPFVVFSLPSPAEEGSERTALVGTWHPDRANPWQMYKTKNNNNNNLKYLWMQKQKIIWGKVI